MDAAEAMRLAMPMQAKRRTTQLVEASLAAWFGLMLVPMAVMVESLAAAGQTLQHRVFYANK